MAEQVIGSSVNIPCGNDMVPVGSQILYRIRDRRRTRRHEKGCRAAFQSCHSFFEYFLCGVGQSSVDIARIGQIKPGCRMGTVVKHIGGRLIDGNRSRAGCRIRQFLSYMKLQRLKLEVSLCSCLFGHVLIPRFFGDV